MKDHVTQDIADYIEGRLDPERESRVKAHLDDCADCAADLTLALQLQEYGALQGMRHLSAERIAALATEPGARMEALEGRHLEECALCKKELDLARACPDDAAWDAVVSHHGAAKHKAEHGKRWFRTWKLLPATLVAAAAVVLLVIALPDREDFSHLARVEPLPVHISRGAVTPGSFEALRRRGLELYRDGQYASAREPFTRANEMRPDAEVQLYLGSIELLLGDAEVAAAILEAILEGGPRGAIRDEALWQLANALLANGQTERAKKTLQDVIEARGNRVSDARDLLENLQP